MKPKNFTLVALALVVATIGISIWWFTQSKAPEKVKLVATPAPTSAPAKSAAVKQVAYSTQIAQPTAPPVPSKSDPAAQTSAANTPANTDPQADLKTAIPDIARLFRAGDTITLWTTYYPPDVATPEVTQLLQQQRDQEKPVTDPDELQMLKHMDETIADDWAALASQTPTFSPKGDEALYQYTQHSWDDGSIAGQYPIVFIKIDGKWYIKRKKN